MATMVDLQVTGVSWADQGSFAELILYVFCASQSRC
jgi:hypothetical protein